MADQDDFLNLMTTCGVAVFKYQTFEKAASRLPDAANVSKLARPVSSDVANSNLQKDDTGPEHPLRLQHLSRIFDILSGK